MGLGNTSMIQNPPPEGIFFAEKGILLVVPYCNPWSWMNEQAVRYTDELVDVLLQSHHLADTLPIVSTGLSMGGLAALVYTRYAKRTPVSCVANCPVCDLVFHYSERPDLPRTLYSAFFQYETDLEQSMKSASPLHLAPEMPKISYHIFHCDQDEAVLITEHSQKFVSAMKDAHHKITFDIVEGRGHCALTEEMKNRFPQYCTDEIERCGA